MSYVVARLTAREWCSNLTLYKKYICLYTRSIANSPAPMWKFPAGKRRVTTQLPHPPTHHSVPGLLLQEPPPVIHHLFQGASYSLSASFMSVRVSLLCFCQQSRNAVICIGLACKK